MLASHEAMQFALNGRSLFTYFLLLLSFFFVRVENNERLGKGSRNVVNVPSGCVGIDEMAVPMWEHFPIRTATCLR